MRDVVIFAVIGVCSAVALVHPWLGVMTWTVVSIMNPHRYAWVASTAPVAAVVAIATMAGLVFTRDRVRLIAAPSTWALVAFMIWICITLPFSIHFDAGLELWSRALKIDLMILVALAALYTRKHVMALAWVLVISIGFYGFKGGIFTIGSGGGSRVWGPPDSYIEGNNELAVALIMIIPLMRFVQMQLKAAWARHGMTAWMILCATAAVGTQSRGALLAIIAMSVMVWWRGRSKILVGLLTLLVAWALFAFMPDQWDTRMSTIAEYEQDSSATGRINAWWMAWNLARDRFFGGGFAIYDPDVFALYAPHPDDVHAAHSIYFQVLGEHGFVGLALFLLLWILVWRSAGWLRRNAADQAECTWASNLGAMCQASIAAYAVGGAFLSLAYFDLPYNLLVLIVVARRWVEDRKKEEAAKAPVAENYGALPSATRP
jgi:probable O-glycosylation ligase (exosortase A-associated)